MPQYRVVKETHGHEFDIGEIVVLYDPLRWKHGLGNARLGIPFIEAENPKDHWYLWPEEYEEITDAEV